MKFKETKGEWYIDVEESGINEHGAKFLSISSQIGKAKIKGIADVYESGANAKLIACAPEMLEILIDIESFATLKPEYRKSIQDLIKKATT